MSGPRRIPAALTICMLGAFATATPFARQALALENGTLEAAPPAPGGVLLNDPDLDRRLDFRGLEHTAEASEPHWAPLFLTLFSSGRFGQDKREHAAWIVRDERGSDRLVIWPFTGRLFRQQWVGERPPGTIALVHTHPDGANPKPSEQDIATARSLGLPVYTISGGAVWKAEGLGSSEHRVGRVFGVGWASVANTAADANTIAATRNRRSPYKR